MTDRGREVLRSVNRSIKRSPLEKMSYVGKVSRVCGAEDGDNDILDYITGVLRSLGAYYPGRYLLSQLSLPAPASRGNSSCRKNRKYSRMIYQVKAGAVDKYLHSAVWSTLMTSSNVSYLCFTYIPHNSNLENCHKSKF